MSAGNREQGIELLDCEARSFIAECFDLGRKSSKYFAKSLWINANIGG